MKKITKLPIPVKGWQIILCLLPALLISISNKAQIPWPFIPQNESHALWAGYGQYETGVFHEGLDIAKDSGTDVVAVEKGIIVECNCSGTKADFLTITRGVDNDSFALGYVHLNIGFRVMGVKWKKGDVVNKGDVLGTLAKLETRAPHLHFEWDNKQHPDSWSATGAVAADLQGNPIDLLNPRADNFLPTIPYPVRYKRQGGAFFGINADERIVSGDTVVQGNTDIIARAYDHFKKYRPKGAAADVLYDISVYKLQFSIKEYKPGNTAEVTTKTPILFEGKITDGETPGIDRNTFNKMNDAALVHVWYSNIDPCKSVRKDGDPTKNLAVNWYYLTNLDSENDRIQRRDADYYWDTNGKEGGRWNDEQEDDEHEADSNKNAAFPDGRYIVKIEATGYGGAADKNTAYDTMSVNNHNEYIYSCDAAGKLKDVYCKGEPVYITGKGYPKNRRIHVYLFKDADWNDGTFLNIRDPKFMVGTSVVTDANGRIQPFKLWNAYEPNGDPDKGYDIIVDYDDDVYYTTPKLGKTVDVLDATPGPYSIIGKKLIIEKSYSDASCFGKCDGTISITVRNGTPPYSYYWNDLGMWTELAQRDSLCAGTYIVTVEDAEGCTISDTTIIRQPADLVVNCNGTNISPTCGSCNGTATMTASGGRPPYTYSWPGGRLTGLCPGTYKGYVTDSSGCTDSCTVTITTGLPLVGYCTSQPAICNSCNGVAIMGGINGVPPYTYSWPNGRLTGLCAGTTVTGTVTDAAGCTFTCTTTIGRITHPGCDTVIVNPPGDTVIVHPNDTVIVHPGTDTVIVGGIPTQIPVNGLPDQVTINKAYPNPFTTQANIEFSSMKAGDAQVIVQNVTGSLVKQYTIKTQKGKNITSIDGTNLPPGIYFIKITTSNSVAIKLYRR